jgi:hypothetical protein
LVLPSDTHQGSGITGGWVLPDAFQEILTMLGSIQDFFLQL